MPPVSAEAPYNGRPVILDDEREPYRWPVIASRMDDVWVDESMMRLAIEPTRWAPLPEG